MSSICGQIPFSKWCNNSRSDFGCQTFTTPTPLHLRYLQPYIILLHAYHHGRILYYRKK